jgi:hypothetical protein
MSGATVRWATCAGALATFGLMLAACGGGTKSPRVASIGPATSTARGSAKPSPDRSGGTDQSSSANGRGGAGGQLRMVGGSAAQMSKFSACMRKNGVPSFPDPNAQGQISISASAGIDPGSAQYENAQQSCQKMLPHGGQPSPAQQARARATALAFSACMRSHGLPNFPDPQFGPGGRVSLRISAGAGLDPQSSQFQAAQTACQKDTPGGVGTKSVGATGSG